MTIRIVTHDRIFHADETFAASVLRIAFDSNVSIIRTREPMLLHRYAGMKDTFLLDVGGRYDPEQRLFDHHQPEGAGFRSSHTREWPYATAGLVWLHYGAKAVQMLQPDLKDDEVQEVVSYIDESLMKYIDAIDCGVRLKAAGPSISALVAGFNPAWYEEEQADSFPLVLDLAQVLVTNMVKRFAGKILARDRVREASRSECGRVLVLDSCLPWSTLVAEEMPEVLYVAYPVNSEAGKTPQWQARVATHADQSCRTRLPVDWAGLDGKTLENKTGQVGAVFCHRSRHLMGANSRDSINGLLELALAEHDRLEGNQMALPLAA